MNRNIKISEMRNVRFPLSGSLFKYELMQVAKILFYFFLNLQE